MTLSHQVRRLSVAALAAVAATGMLLVGVAFAADHAVSIVDRTYEPAQVTVSVGDTVTWTVTKSIGEPHSVTSGKVGEPNAGSVFDSGIASLTNDGQTYQHTFDKPGEVDYFCTVHGAAMSGKVTVLAPGQSPPAAEPPTEGEAHTPIPPERKLLAAGILAVSIVLMFGGAMVWRRMNPA